MSSTLSAKCCRSAPSTLGYVSPVAYEAQLAAARHAA